MVGIFKFMEISWRVPGRTWTVNDGQFPRCRGAGRRGPWRRISRWCKGLDDMDRSTVEHRGAAKPVFPAPEAPVRARLARLAALLSNCTSPYDALMTLARISATIKA